VAPQRGPSIRSGGISQQASKLAISSVNGHISDTENLYLSDDYATVQIVERECMNQRERSPEANRLTQSQRLTSNHPFRTSDEGSPHASRYQRAPARWDGPARRASKTGEIRQIREAAGATHAPPNSRPTPEGLWKGIGYGLLIFLPIYTGIFLLAFVLDWIRL
jgi:hypothetical protein